MTHLIMHKTSALAFSGLLLLGGALAAPVVRAQDAGEPTKPISLNLLSVPIQTALRTLFSSAGIRNYQIDPDVQGFANITVSDVPFNLALRQLLAAVNPPLSYDVENGIYHVKVQKAVTPPSPVLQTATASNNGGGATPPGTENEQKRFYRIPIDKYDAFIIANLLGAQGIVPVPVNEVYPAAGGGGTGGNTGGNRGFGGGVGGNTGGFGGGPNITSVGGAGGGNRFGGGFGGGNRSGGGLRSY